MTIRDAFAGLARRRTRPVHQEIMLGWQSRVESAIPGLHTDLTPFTIVSQRRTEEFIRTWLERLPVDELTFDCLDSSLRHEHLSELEQIGNQKVQRAQQVTDSLAKINHSLRDCALRYRDALERTRRLRQDEENLEQVLAGLRPDIVKAGPVENPAPFPAPEIEIVPLMAGVTPELEIAAGEIPQGWAIDLTDVTLARPRPGGSRDDAA